MRFKDALDLTRAATLAAAFFLLGGLIPVLGMPVMLCTPAPILIHVIGQSRAYVRLGAIVTLALILIGLIAGPIEGLAFALTLGLASVLVVLMVRHRWPFELIIFAATAAMLAAATAALMLWAGSPAALARQLHHSVVAALSQSAAMYQKLGMSQAESKQVGDRMLEVTEQLLPALAAMLGALTLLLNLGLTSRWLGREKIEYQLFNGLATWRTPDWLIWLLLATGFGMFVPQPLARLAALNGFVLVSSIYFCQGLAILAYYLQKLSMPRIVRGTIYVIALLQPVLAALVCLAGVFDMWIDFRRLKPPSQEAGLDDFF